MKTPPRSGRRWRRTTAPGGPSTARRNCGTPISGLWRRRRGALPSAEAGRRFRALSTDYIRLYPGAKELLHTLRAQGRGVYLLSNAQALFTRTELDELGLTDCFDGICLSSDYGVKKPDRRFFEVLFQTYGLSPEGAVMVGNDGICDIQGAREAGLDTVYIRSNLSPDEPAPEADFVLAEMDLGKVLDILTHGRDGTWQAAIR